MSLASAQRTASKAGVVEARARTRYLRRVPGFVVAYIILVLGAVVSLFPYFLALMTSLKPPDQIFSSSACSLPHPFAWQDCIDVVTKYNFWHFLLDTMIYGAIVAIGQLIFGT